MRNEIMAYIGGDMLYKGSQKLREEERKALEKLGYKIYNPQDNKEINDKSNQTKDSNDGLAEKIVKQDTKAMLESDILLFDYQRFAEGTLVEIGQVKGMKDIANMIIDIISNPSLTTMECIHKISSLCLDIRDKKIYPHCEDIRRTNIEEVGDRRSFYINQYVYGVLLELTKGKGLYEYGEILEILKELIEN